MDARKQFADDSDYYRKNRLSSHNSFGAFIDINDDYRLVGKWVCHGWLKRYEMERHNWLDGKKAKYVLSAVMSPHMAKADLRQFIDWLVSRSPYAHIFVDKSVDSILKYGYLVDANHPATFIASAFMCSRFPTESYASSFDKRCKMWRELLDIGYSETEAYFFAQMYEPKSLSQIYPITPARLSSGHTPFHSSLYQEDYVRRFLAGTPILTPTMSKLSNGKGYEEGTVNNLWGRQSNGSEAFWNAVKAIIPQSVAKAKDHHIFRVVRGEGWEYKNRTDFTSVIEQLRGIIHRV